MAHDLAGEKNAWTPDLIGPIFKRDSLTLKQALNLRNADEQIHLLATFVPDEVIYEIDLSKKSFRSSQAVLMFLNMNFSKLFKKYINNKNGGSLALTAALNNYIHIVACEVYCSDGDVLKFFTKGLLMIWKVRDDEFMFDTMRRVILCATRIQSRIAALKNENQMLRGISAGNVMFSVIGDDKARHFVIFGQPIEELKRAQNISSANDIILSSTAWQHCTPSQYEYVIKDSYNVKIIRMLEQSNIKSTHTTFTSSDVHSNLDKMIERKSMLNSIKPFYSIRPRSIFINSKSYFEMPLNNDSYAKEEDVSTAISAIAKINPDFGVQLRSYLMKPVIQQIEKGQSLEFLTEIRQITAISFDAIPNKCPDHELILLTDQCFVLLHSIAAQYAGCINTMNLCDKNIFFCIVFGIRGSDDDDQFKINQVYKNAITCAIRMLKAVKEIAGIHNAFVGISTGMACCGVIGHTARKHYAIIGPTIDKADKIYNISYGKISCDYDTVLHSHLSKDQFRSRGLRLQRFERCHIYEYLDDSSMKKDFDATSSLDYCYPILGRTHELKCFDSILDEIGVADRNYSGLLIKGSERSGKSRLLDAFVTNVCNRQIKPIKLSLDVTYAEKSYSVVYHVLLQLLDAEGCDMVKEREKALLDKLSDILALKDFCYLNPLMRVSFPLSDIYIMDSDWRRHTKTISIFETILKTLETKICILLDDIQHMDYKSWQFLSAALNNPNIVLAMTMTPSSWKDLTHAEVEIDKEKRLTKRTLHGLESNLLPAFACQFLNVLGISRKLKRGLQRRQDGYIGWCEIFLTSILQSNSLDFITISYSEIEERDLVLPHVSLVTKLPVGLTLEEKIPSLQRTQMNQLNVCMTNERYSEIFDTNRDIKELMTEIYLKMNLYEQSFITCAAILGKVFKRVVLQNVMQNAILPHTIKAIFEMIRMRILECASHQRRNFYYAGLISCVDKRRKTFSDMHHLLSCNCHHSHANASISLPQYAHCKMLEFKTDLFRKIIYDMQSDINKEEHHARTARIYLQDARKCTSCGGGNFLRIFSKNIFIKRESPIRSPEVSLVRRRSVIEDQNDKWSLTRRSILSMNGITTRKQESFDSRRISIMPTYFDDEEDEVSKMESKENFTMERWFRRRSTSIAPETTKDASSSSCLDEFSHIDFRDCQCDNIISYLFSRLHQHIENSGNMSKILDFLMEYSAGLIQTAQSLFAIKLLTIAAKRIETADREEWTENTENITNKGIILALTGDAHSALGNQTQAKNCYDAALRLRSAPPKMNKEICYSMLLRFYCILPLVSPDQSVNEMSGQLAVKKLEMASCLRRLCVTYAAEDKLKTAQVVAIQSIKLGFPIVGNFLEKSEIYLAAVQVLYRTRNMELLQHVEKSMLAIVKMKISWHEIEEITMAANIYLTMYQTRALRGDLEEAIDMGIKVLKISSALHLNELMLTIVPSLIEIMLWTKRINNAVDLMHQLFFLADSDIDLSARTWYYALSLELILDAGVVLEPYESSYNYYKKFIAYRSKSCVLRDPQSLCRLMTCLWMYQNRMGYVVTNALGCSVQEYTRDINHYNFAQIFSCCMGLECYLLILLRCVNLKHSTELLNLIQNIGKMIKCLNSISSHAAVIKPRLYLMVAYLYVIRGRKSSTRFYLHRAQKFATSQGNTMTSAWIVQNKRTWIEKIYNNMARYWLEHVESEDIVAWQHIGNFNIDTWSTILYSLSTPDSHV